MFHLLIMARLNWKFFYEIYVAEPHNLLFLYNIRQHILNFLLTTPLWSEADRLNKNNQEIGEMRAPNISRDKGLFL